MSDGIKDHFEELQKVEYQREREFLLTHKMGTLHNNIRGSADILARYLADDRPMTKVDRTRLERALKNLQDLLK